MTPNRATTPEPHPAEPPAGNAEPSAALPSRISLTHAVTARILATLPEHVREQFYTHRDELSAHLRPVGHLEQVLLEIYAFAVFSHQRACALEFTAMEAALANPQDKVAREDLVFFSSICAKKLLDSQRALKDFQSAQQNRMIAKSISEEFNRLVPASTPFIQTCTKRQIRSVISPYTMALASIFPEFEPNPELEEQPEKQS